MGERRSPSRQRRSSLRRPPPRRLNRDPPASSCASSLGPSTPPDQEMSRSPLEVKEGKSAQKLRNWTAGHSKRWLSGVRVVALDLTDTYRSGLHPHLSHAHRVADPFHVV